MFSNMGYFHTREILCEATRDHGLGPLWHRRLPLKTPWMPRHYLDCRATTPISLSYKEANVPPAPSQNKRNPWCSCLSYALHTNHGLCPFCRRRVHFIRHGRLTTSLGAVRLLPCLCQFEEPLLCVQHHNSIQASFFLSSELDWQQPHAEAELVAALMQRIHPEAYSAAELVSVLL